MEHRIISNSRELSCELLIYCMELGKSLLKLWRKLSLGKSTSPMDMAMAISRGMYVIMWCCSCWNSTVDSWCLRCIYGLISLLWVLWSSGDSRAAMWNLRWGSRLALA